MGQWVSRMPKNIQIKDLIQACQNRKNGNLSDKTEAKRAVNLIKKLKESNPLKQAL